MLTKYCRILYSPHKNMKHIAWVIANSIKREISAASSNQRLPKIYIYKHYCKNCAKTQRKDNINFKTGDHSIDYITHSHKQIICVSFSLLPFFNFFFARYICNEQSYDFAYGARYKYTYVCVCYLFYFTLHTHTHS